MGDLVGGPRAETPFDVIMEWLERLILDGDEGRLLNKLGSQQGHAAAG